MAGTVAVGQAVGRWVQRRQVSGPLHRQHREYAASHDHAIEPRLTRDVDRVVATFGVGLAHPPNVETPPAAHADPSITLRETAAFVARRSSLGLSEIETAFVASLPVGRPAAVVGGALG